jgi:hypothetical protein
MGLCLSSKVGNIDDINIDDINEIEEKLSEFTTESLTDHINDISDNFPEDILFSTNNLKQLNCTELINIASALKFRTIQQEDDNLYESISDYNKKLLLATKLLKIKQTLK